MIYLVHSLVKNHPEGFSAALAIVAGAIEDSTPENETIH
jgi:hypothetical protein